MVIDDDTDNCLSLEMLIGLWGYECTTAASGVQSLEIAAGFRPDVVTMDLAMPGMDGFDVLRRLRELPEMLKTKFVALTACGQPKDIARCKEVGFIAHLLKPAHPADLYSILAQCASHLIAAETVAATPEGGPFADTPPSNFAELAGIGG